MDDVQHLVAEALKGIEPAAVTLGAKIDTRLAFEASIAISLKRIADAIEGTPDRLSLTDSIMSAIEQGIIGASGRG